MKKIATITTKVLAKSYDTIDLLITRTHDTSTSLINYQLIKKYIECFRDSAQRYNSGDEGLHTVEVLLHSATWITLYQGPSDNVDYVGLVKTMKDWLSRKE